MKKILFVDDDDTFQTIMQHLAFESGVKVDKCFDAHSAINMSEFEDYDIVLVDQRLPKMDGLDLIKILKVKYPLTDFYLITNFPQELMDKKIKDVGLKGFIDKHYLYEKIQEVFCA